MKIVAICIFGIESVLSRELRNLGFKDLNVENGRISFDGSFEDVAVCNLWLRTAERIYIEVGNFRATDFDLLYDGIKSIKWNDLLPSSAAFPVRASSIDSKLFSTRDIQRISKKALADSLGESYGKIKMSEEGELYPIEIFIFKDVVSVCLDTTGTGLHKRGYRTFNVEAPLKETIAAALIGISYWRPGRVLLDPFCGSGTFPIEAAMIANKIAPGINRGFLFDKWSLEYENKLNEEKEKAITNEKTIKEVFISGSDISSKNVDIAVKHANKAKVSGAINFKVSDFNKLTKIYDYGILIANPPYGQRISEKSEVINLYKNLGEKMKEYDTWSKYILTDEDSFENIVGYRANKKRKVYNGTIRCTFFQYFGPKPINS